MNRYARFVKETWAEMEEENPGATFGQISQGIAEVWNLMTEEEKEEYECEPDTQKSRKTTEATCNCKRK